MEIKIGSLLTIQNTKYTVMDVVNYEGKKYAFTNEVDEDEIPTETFILFEIVNGTSVLKVEDKDTLNKVLAIVSKNVQRIIDKVKDIKE